MIREDRIQLNERFIQVFKLLEERGDIVLNDRNGKGMGDFAERILGNRAYGHIVRAFLNREDKRVIDYRHARALCREYGVNETFLIDGDGTPFGFDLAISNGGEEQIKFKGNILFTNVQAFAGSGEAAGAAASEQNSYFSLPGVSGSGLVALPVEGSSMEPVINDGDVVICREISGVYEIKDDEIYAVKSDGYLWIKYVKKIEDGRGSVKSLKLISANFLEFDPFEAEVSEYTRLYKVIRKISNM